MMDCTSNSFEKVKTDFQVEREHCTITATLQKFSSESIHQPNQVAEQYVDYKVTSDLFNHYYPVTVYGNGSDTPNKGYISVEFGMENAYVRYAEIMCVVAVIDVEGSKRFSQSFVFVWDRHGEASAEDSESKFAIDRYLSRGTLLDEPNDFLLNDILTLNIEIQLTENFEILYVHDIRSSFVELAFETRNLNECKYSLFFESLVAERLREESRYFKRIMATPMAEKKTRYMNVPADEYQTFVEVGCLLLGANSIHLDSFGDILRLYVFADKYDLPVVLDTCRGLLKSCLVEDNVSHISDFACMYDDYKIQESVAAFLEKSRNKEPSEDEHYLDKRLITDWVCEGVSDATTSYLVFTKQQQDENKGNDFDFYK